MRPQKWIAKATKDFKQRVVWFVFVKLLKRGGKLNNFAGDSINDKSCSRKSIIPVSSGKTRLRKKGQSHFNNMSMLSLS